MNLPVFVITMQTLLASVFLAGVGGIKGSVHSGTGVGGAVIVDGIDGFTVQVVRLVTRRMP